jgi:hypothetical protein
MILNRMKVSSFLLNKKKGKLPLVLFYYHRVFNNFERMIKHKWYEKSVTCIDSVDFYFL